MKSYRFGHKNTVLGMVYVLKKVLYVLEKGLVA